MKALADRKTKLIFETSDQVRERGAYRQVVVEARPSYAVLRLKGLRTSFQLCYGTAYQMAARFEAERKRAEMKGKKRS
jgi:hypothetical protein